MTPFLEYLKSTDSPTLCNAIELLKVRPHNEGFTPLQIRCLFPQFGRMCGYAVTAQVERMTASEPFDLDRFIELYRAVEAAPKPAVIAFQEIGGHPDYAAHCGEVMATCFTRLGAIGLVSDCGVRDLPGVRALGFHYFARGSVASHSNFRIARVGSPVQVCGLVIHPGDLLHGDENGLVSIPAGHEEELKQAVDTVRSREGKLLAFVRGDGFTIDGIRGNVVE
ncbi:MAG: RraA family protein [Acidobacteriota bacterium]|nr:RraA family protein [Acidobacteriota bacterium]